jgi:hypothetical protein
MAPAFNRWRFQLNNLKKVMSSVLNHPRRSLRHQLWLTETIRASKYCDQWTANGEDERTPSSRAHETSDQDNAFWNYFASHTEGRGIFKIRHYFDIYHRHLSKFVGERVHVVEIGVQSGGSLEMWRRCFGPKCHVTGIDIQEGCKVFEDPATTVLIGDQADRSFWAKFRERCAPVDVLIDDGGHETEQQMVTLEEMLPYLRPGGVYICEDVWRPNYAFRAFAYSLVENLNDFEFGVPAEFQAIPTPFQASVNSIHFYPLMVVIERNQCLVNQFVGLRHGTEWKRHNA